MSKYCSTLGAMQLSAGTHRYVAYYIVLNSIEWLAYAVLCFAAWPKKSERKAAQKVQAVAQRLAVVNGLQKLSVPQSKNAPAGDANHVVARPQAEREEIVPTLKAPPQLAKQLSLGKMDAQSHASDNALRLMHSLSNARERSSFHDPGVPTPRGGGRSEAEDSMRRVTESDEADASSWSLPSPPPAPRPRKHSDDDEPVRSPPPAPRTKQRRGSEDVDAQADAANATEWGPPLSPRQQQQPLSPRQQPPPLSPQQHSSVASPLPAQFFANEEQSPNVTPVQLTLVQGGQARSAAQSGSPLVTLAVSPSPRHARAPDHAGASRSPLDRPPVGPRQALANAAHEVRVYRANPTAQAVGAAASPTVSPRMVSPRIASPRRGASPRRICVYRPFAASSSGLPVHVEPPPLPSAEFIARVRGRMLTHG